MKLIRLETPEELIRFTTEHGPVVSLYVARRARGVSRQRIARMIELGRLTPLIVLGEPSLILREVLSRGCQMRNSPDRDS